MTNQERLATLNAAILAVRPHGMLAVSVLEPLQTLRDDLATESASVPVKLAAATPSPTPDAAKPTNAPITK